MLEAIPDDIDKSTLLQKSIQIESVDFAADVSAKIKFDNGNFPEEFQVFMVASLSKDGIFFRFGDEFQENCVFLGVLVYKLRPQLEFCYPIVLQMNTNKCGISSWDNFMQLDPQRPSRWYVVNYKIVLSCGQ